MVYFVSSSRQFVKLFASILKNNITIHRDVQRNIRLKNRLSENGNSVTEFQIDINAF